MSAIASAASLAPSTSTTNSMAKTTARHQRRRANRKLNMQLRSSSCTVRAMARVTKTRGYLRSALASWWQAWSATVRLPALSATAHAAPITTTTMETASKMTTPAEVEKRARELIEEYIKAAETRMEEKLQAQLEAATKAATTSSMRSVRFEASEGETARSTTSSMKASSAGLSEEFAKYQKMLSFGVPEPAVAQKMVKDGVDPTPLLGSAYAGLFKKTEIVIAPRNEAGAAKHAPAAPATPGLRITVDAIQSIRSGLRKTPRKYADVGSAGRNSASKGSSVKMTPMRDITNQFNASVNSASRSPSMAKNDGEFLQLALQRKFKNTFAHHRESPLHLKEEDPLLFA